MLPYYLVKLSCTWCTMHTKRTFHLNLLCVAHGSKQYIYDLLISINIKNHLSNNTPVTYQLTWNLTRLLCKACCIDQKEYSIQAQAKGEFLPTCIPGVETSQSASDTSVSQSISFSRDLFWWPLTSTLYTAHTWSYPDLIVKRKWRAANFASCNEFTWWQSSVMPISVMGGKEHFYINVLLLMYMNTQQMTFQVFFMK